MSLIRLQSCQTCKHGERLPHEPAIECRRYPPTVTATMVPRDTKTMGIAMQATFPKVPLDLRCGEWGPRLAISASELSQDIPMSLAA